jgi:polyhydroxyalkanoate synthase
MRGTLSTAGHRATPAALDMPLLTVLRPESLIIPPATVRPLYEAAPSRTKRLLQYEGDHGVAHRHLGILVGERAHRCLWPAILDWVGRRATA